MLAGSVVVSAPVKAREQGPRLLDGAPQRRDEALVLGAGAVGHPQVPGAAEAHPGPHRHAGARQRAHDLAPRRARPATPSRSSPGCRRRRDPARVSSSSIQRRSTTFHSTRRATSSWWRSASVAAACARWLTENGWRTRSTAALNSSEPSAKPDAQAGEAVGLGERAQDHEVVEAAQQVERGVRVLDGLELDVGLVEDHEHVRRDALEQRADRVAREVRAGRVVRVADQHQPRLLGDRGRHRIQVVDVPVGQRHRHLAGIGRGGQVRIHRERRPRVDDLAPRLEQRLGRGEQDLAGAVAHRDARDRVLVAVRERAPQGAGAGIGIAVHLAGGPADRLHDALDGRERRLVRRQHRDARRLPRGGLGAVGPGRVVRNARQALYEGDGTHAGTAYRCGRYWAASRSARSARASRRYTCWGAWPAAA